MDRSSAAHGIVAGLAATALMTLAMRLLHARLPHEERYPLPPRLLTDAALDRSAIPIAGEAERTCTAMAAHFAYGAAAGLLYSALGARSGMLRGAGYGLAVWLGSYCGWIPAAGLLAPPMRHPPRRTALMLAAHVVWGGTLAICMGYLDCGECSRARPRTSQRHTSLVR